MSLNITNLLNTLKGYYDPEKNAGERYTGNETGMQNIISAYGLSGSAVNEIELTNESLSRNIIENGTKVTISSNTPAKFSYRIDSDNGKIIIFGNNLTITVDENDSDLIEVIGISNTINGNGSSDKFNLIGYDNEVNGNDGEDTVTVYGADNTLKNSEINIFNGVGGQTLIVDNKEFKVSINDSLGDDAPDEITLKSNINENGQIVFETDSANIEALNDNADNIILKGDDNKLNSKEGNDELTINGRNNTIISGEGIDNVYVKGSNTQVIGDENDIVTYNENSGSITLKNDDKSSHYIEYEDSDGVMHKFFIKRNSDTTNDVTILYSFDSNNKVTFTCNNAYVDAQSDIAEVISIVGNYNYIDSSSSNDNINIKGDNNIIIPGEGNDEISISGNSNKISGDENDVVYYTSNSGGITIPAGDDSQHYIDITDSDGVRHYFCVERNIDSERDISLTYELSSTGNFEFEGDNFKITQMQDGVKDNISIKGDYNYIDTGDEDDVVTIEGSNNQVHAGEGNDTLYVVGESNKLYGDEGEDSIGIEGKNNETDGFEEERMIYVLNADNPSETITLSDGKTYKVEIKDSSKIGDDNVIIKYIEEDGILTIEADDVIITAGKGQADNIKFIGSNSKIFAGDKNDIIDVKGDSNYIDGWSGNDTITANGINNKAYGFLGDDDITLIQRELSDEEIESAIKDISDKDDKGNTLSEEDKKEIIIKNRANIADGEFDTDSVTASKYSKVSVNTEIYKSLSQEIKIRPNEDEKKIVITDEDNNTYSYTIKNYVTFDNGNPFVSARTISYELKDIEIDGVTKKQLVVKGDYISVVADNNQGDVVKIIGDNNFLDLGEGMDYLEAEGNYNLLFGGIGKDFINVSGDNNDVYGDSKFDMQDKDDSDTITVNGSENMVTGSRGDDVITLYGDSFKAFGGEGDDSFNVYAVNSEIYGGGLTSQSGNDTLIINDSSTNYYRGFSNTELKKDENKIILSPDNLQQNISYTDVDGTNVVFKIEPNILTPEELAGEIYVDYIVNDVQIDGETQKVLVITGSNIMINLTEGSDKSVNIKLIGDDNRLETFGGNDNIDIDGSRNEILSGNGENKIYVTGNNNKIQGGENVDKIDVSGNYNNVIGNGNNDNISVEGINNNTRYYIDADRNGGSLILTNNNGNQVIVMNNRAYELSLYKLSEEELETAQVNVSYKYDDDGYMCFYAENVKIRVIDSKETTTTDENITDNQDSLKLFGNHCYISGSNGVDNIIVEGNYNTVDGWYGNDSLYVIGDSNEVRGFDGNDNIIIKGNDNKINGEQGTDTLTVEQGENNTYTNIDKLIK